MKINSAKIWPIAIASAITMVFGFGVTTIIVTSNSPVEKSDAYMQDYHVVDANANKMILSKLSFDKKYNISYLPKGLSQTDTVVEYKITDKANNPVNNAKIKILITRPDKNEFDVNMDKPKISNGIYTFDNIKLQKRGRWNIIAKIDIGKEHRYYNLKVDTRKTKVTEY